MNFKKGLDPKQEFLIAKKPGDYVKEEHMAKAVYAISEKLNMQNIIEKYSELGQNAYNPLMLIRIIFYGYAIGVRSSRKLAKACEERLDFLYLADGLKPSHNAISDFRKENLEEMKVHFQEILLIAAGLNIVSLGNLNVCIDGSKIKANASPKLSKDEDKLQELLDKTQADINRMFQEAEEIDRQEDDLYGKENRGDENFQKKLETKKKEKRQ
jgi:transposase